MMHFVNSLSEAASVSKKQIRPARHAAESRAARSAFEKCTPDAYIL
jgi:hypothetical protein